LEEIPALHIDHFDFNSVDFLKWPVLMDVTEFLLGLDESVLNF